MEFTISPTLGINERIASMHNVYDFGLGQSPFPVIPSMVEALKNNAHQKDYVNVKGLLPLRKEIARFHKRNGVDFDPEDMIIGPGSKELLFSLLFTCEADVFIPTPCWVTYPPQCIMTNRKAIFMHCEAQNNWRLTPQLLEDTFASNESSNRKFLILNYPNNPCGYTYSKEEIINICSVCHIFKVTIISDEIYGLLTHDGHHYSTSLYSRDIIVTSGISKWAGAGGWRLGYMAFTEQNRDLLIAMKQMVSETYTSVSAPIQHAAIHAFKETEVVNHYLAKARKALLLFATKIDNILKKVPSIKFSKMEGGFYFFLDATALKEKMAKHEIYTSNAFATFLLEKHQIAALPGSSFGRPKEELSLRFAYVDFDGSRLMKYGLNELTDSVIQQDGQKLIEGVKKLKQVLTNF
ncbi:MAG: pyridoxal phosphate-dependent aminotransferase [Cytophagales bacterium]|nr:pyridoxal phosphate-dependent aminotransferase [Cytophagales bacterium]